MFLQGNLQTVFDALYTVGAIDPVLKMDWDSVTKQMESEPHKVNLACQTVNDCDGNLELLIQKLNVMESKMVQFVALEVAREFCEFQDRKSLQ